MNLIQITGRFYEEDGEAARKLAGLIGEAGNVSYMAEAQIADFRLEWTRAGGYGAPALAEALTDARSLLSGAGISDGNVFEVGAQIEELVDVAGNLHKRGPLIEAQSRERQLQDWGLAR